MRSGRRDAERRPAEAPGAAGGSAADPIEVAREICLHQLAARARSRAELATTLRRRGVADEVAEVVLDRLTAVGLVDDSAFAAAFVSSARAQRGLGRQALAAELRRRGVQPKVVEEATAVVEESDEEETARDLVRRRLASMGRLPVEVRARRLVAMLARRGYSIELAVRVVYELVGATDDGEDEPPELDDLDG
ncbi:Regulatory protein RecX [Frankia canadensis]|uniref:Regulatory protein RecX n=1 Tax=Frankia canadensis TaxID=1836972 RepID=A0A2I2KTT2_9ACTN|nr:recombination regulator RecX [Frankia canadensis]SNQ49066.1 Regulatory protein RecX [Frankia canadensis]SOU56356.1 Regulatory protein RecX [Frankia canadensis]